jgi:coenzyme F420-reducing hydrogenase beta subunit
MTYLKSNRKEDCCGCRACENACFHGALEMKTDEEGFFYPTKNNTCINCGLCEIVCPYNSKNLAEDNNEQSLLSKRYPITFAAYSNEDRIGSSSGGIFYTLAKDIICKGGIVYGAAFDDKFQLKHIAASTLEELAPMRGSKYIQSNIGLIYRDIKEKLISQKSVLFTGTPCQVAGLKSFLGKKYDLLLTTDLICHGTPSQWMFDQHKNYIQKKNGGKLSSYHFRNDYAWEGCEIYDFVKPDGSESHIKIPTYELSPYLYSFMHAFDCRLSCYECPFAKIPRQGDITLGDYWGIEKIFPDIDSSSGVSAVLVNTPKGMEAWNDIKDKLIYLQSTYNMVDKFNKNLLHNTLKPSLRTTAYKIVLERGYADVANKEFRSPIHNIIRIKVLIKENSLFLPIISIYRKLLNIL